MIWLLVSTSGNVAAGPVPPPVVLTGRMCIKTVIVVTLSMNVLQNCIGNDPCIGLLHTDTGCCSTQTNRTWSSFISCIITVTYTLS